MSIHVSQFYPCSDISLACELYYICELGKYLKTNYEDSLSLDGVILHKDLKKAPIIWEYFRMSVDLGYVVDCGIDVSFIEVTEDKPLDLKVGTYANFLFTTDVVPFDSEDLNKRRTDYDYAMKTPTLSQISFEVCDNESGYWLWSIAGENGSGKVVNNKSLNHNHANQAWLSFIAFVAVTRLKQGYPNNLILSIDKEVVLNETALSYLYILSEYSSVFTGWCHFHLSDTISETTALQMQYTAWYIKGRDFGMLDRWYSGKEKLQYLKDMDVQVGDLVMLYQRDKAQKQNYIKSIIGCHLGKITFLTESTIGIEYINTTKPYFQGKEDFDNHTTIVKRMYMDNPPYENLSITKRTYDLANTGVEYMLHDEQYFILPLDQCDDIRLTRVSDGSRKDTLVLHQNDLIYWILKDYNYEFNESRFLARYFSNSEPAYTRYMRGEVLEDNYYYREE